MVMTVNADASISAPLTFRSESLYTFRFDPNGDAREGVTFKGRVGDPTCSPSRFAVPAELKGYR